MGDNTRKVLAYLADKASSGSYYLRSKNIASDIDLSSKQVGVEMGRINESYEEVIEQNPSYLEENEELMDSLEWARARSTTWYTKPFALDDILNDIERQLVS